MNNTLNGSNKQLLEDCDQADKWVRNPLTRSVRLVHLVLSTVSIIQMAHLLYLLLFSRQQKQKLLLHPNLAILLINILFLYAIVVFIPYFGITIRFELLMLFSTSPCSMITPIWLSFCLRFPAYINLFSFPLFHFAVVLERLRATNRAKEYEKEGPWFGIALSALIWTFTALANIPICYYFLKNAKVDYQVFITMTSPQTGDYLTDFNYFFFALIVFSSFGDCVIYLRHRRSRRIDAHCLAYSLSREFQRRENEVTLRLIIPLDLSYAITYSLYNLLIAHLRTISDQLGGTGIFLDWYDWINCLLFLHRIVTLYFYIRFVRDRQRWKLPSVNSNVEDQQTAYFTQLRSQWN